MTNYLPVKTVGIFFVILLIFMFLDTPVKDNFFDGCDCECDNDEDTSIIVIFWNWLFGNNDDNDHDDSCHCDGITRGGQNNMPPDFRAAPASRAPDASGNK